MWQQDGALLGSARMEALERTLGRTAANAGGGGVGGGWLTSAHLRY